jgi:8-oxo-dGTP diphosphatase
MDSHPRIGVGVIIVNEGCVLLGERRGAHGAGTWALPGGHLEFGETPEQCAQREVLEETGLELHTFATGPYTNDVFTAEQRHYVTLFLLTRSSTRDARVCEPTKCARWDWFRWDALPSPLFQPLATLHRSGYVPAGVER